MFINKKKCLDI
jgi:hypothetical protein